jgi:hypothetical protein
VAKLDERARATSGRSAGDDTVRGVSPQNRRATGRQTGKFAGNSGVFIGLEEHGDYVYARYEAIHGTWISASLAERGYDQQYGPSTAFGAYLNLAVDSNLEPFRNPDRIEPGLQYLIPVRKIVRQPPPKSTPPRAPLTPLVTPQPNQKAEPFSESPLSRAAKDLHLFVDRHMAYPSFELDRDLPPPDREPRAAVKYWLEHHREEILEGERRFRVSRVAIAGIIAWEALNNPQVTSNKSVGVGKLHLVAEPGDISWPEAVENAGKMPKLTLAERYEFLQNSRLCMLYIAATLDLICEEGEKYGFNLRSSPGILGHIYHSRPPRKWAAQIKAKKITEPFALQPGGMGAWISDNQKYLESAVGTSSIP